MIGLSACGSGSPQTSGVASLGTTTSTTTSDASAPTNSTGAPTGAAHQSALGFAECIRAHGIADFPDPRSTGSITFDINSGVNPQSAQFQAAQGACKKFLPARSATSAAPTGPSKAVLIKYAKCMRAHGIADFPDPVLFPGGG